MARRPGWPRKGSQGRRATRTVNSFPVGHTCGEPIFVPRVRGGTADTGDDGYLLTFAHDRGRGTSTSRSSTPPTSRPTRAPRSTSASDPREVHGN
ncbi:carotenoid oxygenase family protein [Sorangium sp. So ce1099]|uniref:carotenoid oxygenase family protein n=1 Tax=Sorangium sp. So ce1099 TaxID=3133331 RepID=UPI003F5F975B